ncbi:hypothetical protein BC831DRAFT_450883, partial [Entophlyctis helioformis]
PQPQPSASASLSSSSPSSLAAQASAAGGLLLKRVPLGTSLVMGAALLLLLLNWLTGSWVYGAASLAPTNYTHAPLVGLPRLIGFQFVHSGLLHFVCAVLLFPLVASSLEASVGTVLFLHIFFVTGLATAVAYIVSIWIWSWLWPSWGLFPIGGLDIPFFTFLAIESLSKRGLYEAASRMGYNLPELVFPLPFIVAGIILMPYTSWVAHICAALVGFFYFLGLLDSVMLQNAHIHAIETSGMFAFWASRPTFVPAPGAVALPLPGAYPTGSPDLMNPTHETGSARGSIVTRIKNAFSSSSYSPLGDAPGGGVASYNNPHHDVDPLLWDEEDGLDSPETAHTAGAQASTVVNVSGAPARGGEPGTTLPGAF